MFNTLPAPVADPILKVMTMYREDNRNAKVDLGLGVYKDPQGNTPVMRAVKAAEARLVEQQATKSYTTLSGDPAFRTAMARLSMIARHRGGISVIGIIVGYPKGSCGPSGRWRRTW